MKTRILPHILTVIAAGVLMLTVVFLLAQNSRLSEEIKQQTDINQRYLRCILLIEREQFANVELRVDAIDKCAIESKTPNGNSSGTQPTTEQRETFEAQPAQQNPTSRTTQPTQTTAPEAKQSTQASAPSTASAPAPQPVSEPQPQPSLVEQITKPITDLLGGLI